MAFYIFFLALFIALLTCEKAVPPNDFLFLTEFSGDNKLYILGDMLELGENSISEHQTIIDELSKYNQEVILVGKEFNKCEHNFTHFFNSKDAHIWIEKNPIKDMYILLKGSRGIKLEKLKEVL